MRYTNKSNKSFIRINDEMEIKALKYALTTTPRITSEIFRRNKAFYMERYFKAFPEEKQKYDYAKNRLKKLSFLISIGAVAVVTLGGIAIRETASNNKYEPVIATEQSDDFINKTQEFKSKFVVQPTDYKQLSESQGIIQEVKELSTEEAVNKHRKEIIAELYNKEHPNNENPMTAERLGIMKRSLNYLYNRTDENGNVIAKVAESQKKASDIYENEYLKNAYEFYIDDQLVAFYHQNAIKIINANIGENQDEFFKEVVDFVNKSENLKRAINQKETVISKIQEQYAQSANQLLNGKSKNENDVEQEK